MAASKSRKAPMPAIRKGQPDPQLTRTEFAARFKLGFDDPAFAIHHEHIEPLIEVAWSAYVEGRKAPRTRRAGDGYADPDYELSVDWLSARAAIDAAATHQRDDKSPTRILVICASPRSEHTCPGEMSKSFRLAETARAVITGSGAECDLLELSRVTAEYGRHIHPCKACVSTAMPLCHWPCSCYPNDALGQTHDWMAEIYARWTAAHGVIIVTPVHWHHAPSVLKLMMDRLVCADGGNPDPTSTQGKDPKLAKRLELDDWEYPQPLAGRAFGLVVHGDTEGVQTLRRSLADWLHGMGLVAAGAKAEIDRYIGYYRTYAESHVALDEDEAIFEETRNAARSVIEQVRRLRAGTRPPDATLEWPRQK